MDKNNQKPYNSTFGNAPKFFVPHAEANYLNAQDVIHHLVGSAKNISIATWNCFENGHELTMNHEIVAELVFEIQTKLEMIEKLLPLAFEGDGGNQ